MDKYAIEGFALAKIWIKNLAEILSVPMERILICPGNHDCSRDILICPEINVADSQKADQILSYPIPDYLLKRFSQYNDFCQELGIVPYKFMGEESYLVGTWKFPKVTVQSRCCVCATSALSLQLLMTI